MNTSKWDRRFLRLAQHVAEWSKDPSTQVGAVIVDDQRRVIGMGYNGFPRGVDDTRERYMDRETKYRLVVHAEANAILNAARWPSGCTMYVTALPCAECAKLIIQSSINAVFAPRPSEDLEERWGEEFVVTRSMFHEAGIGLYEVEQ